jgi:hypothetical protein
VNGLAIIDHCWKPISIKTLERHRYSIEHRRPAFERELAESALATEVISSPIIEPSPCSHLISARHEDCSDAKRHCFIAALSRL